MLLQSIKMLKTVGPLKKGLSIEFASPVTILTGEQKCGKSLLLQIISGKKKNLRENIEIKSANKRGMLRVFDTEHDNPRIKNSIEGDIFLQLYAQKQSSHGDTMLLLLGSLLQKHLADKVSLMLLDEPESGLSLQSIAILIRELSKCTKNNQAVLVSHHPWILTRIPGASVFDLKAKKYIDPEKYMEKCWKTGCKEN